MRSSLTKAISPYKMRSLLLLPLLSRDRFELKCGKKEEGMGSVGEEHIFRSKGVRCAAWLYRPRDMEKPPLVVMAHGFGAERVFGLEPFAERFAGRGMAVFAFDYRCFGASRGQPRNLVNPFRHLNDWKAALAYVRGLPGVDAERLALWGSSFSGGHVLVTAARDGKVRAVVAQVPFVDGTGTVSFLGWPYTAQAVSHALRDLARLLAFREPHYVPLVGEPGSFAVMNTPECLPGYMALVPPGYPFLNACPARVLLETVFYRPLSFADKVNCPTLVVMAENDSLINPAQVERMLERLPRGEVLRLPAGHFDLYSGEIFERAVEREADFLQRELGE